MPSTNAAQRLAAVLALVFALALAPLSFAADDAVKAEFAKLEGTWQVVSHETEGAPASEDYWRTISFVFKGKELTFKGDDVVSKKIGKITLTLDPSTTPRLIDLKIVEGEFKGIMLEGIYEIKDDRLKICYHNDEAKNRPTEFATKKGTKFDLFVLKREKK
jgi:uncharacterized protein (TIGR03067 family)